MIDKVHLICEEMQTMKRIFALLISFIFTFSMVFTYAEEEELVLPAEVAVEDSAVVSAEEEDSSEEETPVEEEAPAEEAAPVEEVTSVEEETSAEEETPVEEESVSVEETEQDERELFEQGYVVVDKDTPVYEDADDDSDLLQGTMDKKGVCYAVRETNSADFEEDWLLIIFDTETAKAEDGDFITGYVQLKYVDILSELETEEITEDTELRLDDEDRAIPVCSYSVYVEETEEITSEPETNDSSAETNVSTVATDKLSAPASVAAESVDATSIKVSWGAVEGAAGYKVYRSLTFSGGYSVVATIEDGATVEYTDTGLTAGTTYYYTVRTIASTGTLSTYSAKVKAVPAEVEELIDYVEKPANVAAESAGATSIKVSWGAVENAVGYKIYRSLTLNGGYSVVATINDGATVEYTDTGLTTGTTYYYILKAIAPTGTLSAYSGKVKAVPAEVEELIDYVEKPANVAAESADATSIKITWDAVENAVGYKIYRSLTFSGGYSVVATIEDGTVVEYTDTDLTTGTTYYYILKAVAPTGTLSAYSAKVEAVPVDTSIELDGILYEVYGDGVQVIGYTEAASSVVIPETVNDLTVVAIGESAFEGNTTLVSIDLPDTIEVIGKRAFANCTSLTTMN